MRSFWFYSNFFKMQCGFIFIHYRHTDSLQCFIVIILLIFVTYPVTESFSKNDV